MKWTTLIAVVLLSVGCASAPSSFSDGVGATYLAIDTAADTIWDLCQNDVPNGPCAPGSAISTEDKQQAKETLQEALDSLQIARQMYQVGEGDAALDRLRQARALLSIVDGIIREHQQ